MRNLRYFVYLTKTKKIVSKPILEEQKAKELSKHFNEKRPNTNVGYGEYCPKLKKFMSIHYAN